jgi:hypothetical protein
VLTFVVVPASSLSLSFSSFSWLSCRWAPRARL